MAITHSYVDYGAGSDATGDGTIGTPWKTLQKAFDTLVRNANDGNQVNLKAGTAHVNAAALDLTTFIAGGALAAVGPLIVRGYTAAANDGGMAEIDCGGATMFAAATYDFVYLIDLEMHTFGNANGVVLDTHCMLFRCEVHRGASIPSNKFLVYIGTGTMVLGCYIHDAGELPSSPGAAIYGFSNPAMIVGNYIANCNGGIFGGYGWGIHNNVIYLNSTLGYGIQATYQAIVTGNTIYNAAAGTNYGINIPNSGGQLPVLNNIICGFSGAGGEGINTANLPLAGYNAFWNNTANYTVSDQRFVDLTANDVALGADPFTDAASGDFSLTAAAKTALAAKGWPLAYLGAHANTVPNLNIGPIQMAASSGGGGAVRILPLRGSIG